MVFVRTSLFFVKCSLLYLSQCSIRKTNPKSFLTMLLISKCYVYYANKGWHHHLNSILWRTFILCKVLFSWVHFSQFQSTVTKIKLISRLELTTSCRKFNGKSGKREWNYFEFSRNLVLSASQITGLIKSVWMSESSSLYDHQLVTVHKNLGRLIWNRWV